MVTKLFEKWSQQIFLPAGGKRVRVRIFPPYPFFNGKAGCDFGLPVISNVTCWLACVLFVFCITNRLLLNELDVWYIWWPTTVTAKPKTSRQKQKHHGKTKNLTAKSNTSEQQQNSFAFAVRFLVLSWDILFLPWGFGFAVRFLFLPWGFCFCREVFAKLKRDKAILGLMKFENSWKSPLEGGLSESKWINRSYIVCLVSVWRDWVWSRRSGVSKNQVSVHGISYHENC